MSKINYLQAISIASSIICKSDLVWEMQYNQPYNAREFLKLLHFLLAIHENIDSKTIDENGWRDFTKYYQDCFDAAGVEFIDPIQR